MNPPDEIPEAGFALLPEPEQKPNVEFEEWLREDEKRREAKLEAIRGDGDFHMAPPTDLDLDARSRGTAICFECKVETPVLINDGRVTYVRHIVRGEECLGSDRRVR